ncbi:putative LysR-family transcriptional regulator [Actinoplanes missouriensis 431]|uniref:Putative LysR-family transcriptional regulator n=1 Tax=Actinoplanes missouriensis (strain ATCC 14538 / DSM 43046 / CBS 188.64 / JCM 3121 / NBRC 102363 / NCIMB 12654 / NRRL B-3342 / UNCC 431) TaxID=512565 RepID=I0H105_ACTM4|nr:LysR family transcriptional regulator [Actinoplanes missouriensis]BAL86692.1 putative LysR-family transcriptional regulator [Actinoplanes missouriensis 431]
MDPHLLRTFVTVAETGSFSLAADRLRFTQSAVSQQIATLEADLGTPLLTRRPVALTAAGERLRRHAEIILVRLEAARADVIRAVAPPGRLALGLTPLAGAPMVAGSMAGGSMAGGSMAGVPIAGGSFAGGSVADVLARLRAEMPRLRIRVTVGSRDRIVAAAATGEVDLGLVDGFAAPSDPLRLPEPGGAGATGIGEHPAVVAVPEGHPIAGRSAVDLADLADAYWIDAPEVAPAGPGLPAADGLRIGLRYDGGDVAVLLGLVAAGHGLALLPAPPVAATPGLRGVPVGTPRLVHRVELLRAPATWTGAEPPARLTALLTG